MSHSLTNLLRTSTALGILLLLPSFAKADAALEPHVSVGVKAGTERSILTTEFWAPLAQQSDRVFYTDLRLMGDDDDNREGNIGFGYRQIVPSTDSVIGGHVWIDRRRTDDNSTFHQLTFGAESLGKVLDFRANGYVPLNGANTIITPNIGSTTPYLAGTGFYYDTNGSINETPQYGMDAEVGYRLPVFEKQIDAFHVYGGGYSFFRDNTQGVNGIRFRTEAQVNSIFTVGARAQYDAARGSQGFLEATLRFPFKAKKLYQQDQLRSRLDENPERDVDIVTSKKADNGLMKPFINPTTDMAQRIIYVDNTAATGGNGSLNHPFNSLTTAQAHLKANDILYVNHGDGTTTNMDQGIVINKAGVSLIGSGSALTYQGYTFLAAGAAPVITNVNAYTGDEVVGNGVTVLADNGLVSGITVDGAQGYGIRIAAIGAGTVFNNATVVNNTVTNVASIGLIVHTQQEGQINSVDISDNTVSNSGNVGIYLQANTGNIEKATINNNVSNNNAGPGILADIGNSNHIMDSLVIKDNTLNNNANNGLYIVLGSSNSSIANISVDDNVTNNNMVNGTWIHSQGTINTINFSNNTANNNLQYGVVTDGAGTINQLTANNITTNYNGITGFFIAVGGGAIYSAQLNQLTASNNQAYGLNAVIYPIGTISNFSLTNSNISNNITGGIALANYGGSFSADIGGGLYGSIGNNRIYNNTVDVLANLAGGNLSAQNNWWGINSGPAPGKIVSQDGSTIDTTNYLTTDPRP